MNSFKDCLRNAQRDVPSLVVWTALSDRKHTGLILEQLANLVGAQVPHFSDFSDSIVSFSVRRTHATDRNSRRLSKRFFLAVLISITAINWQAGPRSSSQRKGELSCITSSPKLALRSRHTWIFFTR